MRVNHIHILHSAGGGAVAESPAEKPLWRSQVSDLFERYGALSGSSIDWAVDRLVPLNDRHGKMVSRNLKFPLTSGMAWRPLNP